MNEPTDEMKHRWKVARNLDVEEFKRLMVEEGHEEPSDYVALAAMHKARVHFAELGHMDKKLGRDSKRWLEMNHIGGLGANRRTTH